MIAASVVICTSTFDRLELTLRCVESVLAGTRPPDQVVVVVDGNEPLAANLTRFLPADVLVAPSGGRGASAARNTGLRLSTRDVVAFVDDDACPEPDWLAQLMDVFESGPSIVCLGGRVQPDYEDSRCTFPDELLWLVGCTYRGHRADPGSIGRPLGANMAFRRKALHAVGGFPSAFGPKGVGVTNYNEEIVTAAALRERFGEDAISYCPGAVVNHVVIGSRLSWRYLIRRSWAEGRSKAGVRRLFGARIMGHDRRYFFGVLLPAMVRSAASGLLRRSRSDARHAGAIAAVAVITPIAYVMTRLRQAGPGRRSSYDRIAPTGARLGSRR